MTRRTTSSGFTLIELSIVLVIIGLIVGGVLVGQTLIRAADIRSITSQVEKFKTAVFTFESKYDCLPGDCANATEFLGSSGCSPGVFGICNGNGNGTIDTSDDAWPGYWGGLQESEQFWIQLGAANLMPGSYIMVRDGSAHPGQDIPVVNNHAYIYFCFNQPASTDANSVYSKSGCGFEVVNPAGSLLWTDIPYTGSETLTAYEAHALDIKIDDGIPSDGSLWGYSASNGTQCANYTSEPWNSPANLNSAYLSDNNMECIPLFIFNPP